MPFHVALISIKIEIYEIIHKQYFKTLGKKSGPFLFHPDLSLELEILHAYRNCIEFLITLKQPMSEMFEKMTLCLSIQNLTNYNGSARIKVKS